MNRLEEIISQVFHIEIEKITNDLSRDFAEEWDSFNHLLLISEIEKRMSIKFTLSEVGQIKTYKQLKDMIDSKK